MASATAGWKSREDYKKQRELEEARKAGTAAPETDEDGKEINPHIPQYIAQAPWYLSNSRPSLKHQRVQIPKPDYTKEWYARGARMGNTPTKFKKGHCTNCGSGTHTVKFCCDRPRKLGAKYTGTDLKPDELIQDLTLDFDGKRDRWNGYDPTSHKKVIEQFEKVEEKRRQKKSDLLDKFMTEPDPGHQRYPHNKTESSDGTKKENKLVDDSDSDSGSDKEYKEYKEDGTASQVTKVDPKTRTTIRNLRIREDTAKYLRNLDLNSAYYDPKTRSMRENPNPNANPEEQVYTGDNTIRNTGDSQKFNSMQYFAWEAYEKGQDLHIQAAPSQAELLYEQFKIKKEALKNKQREAIIARYGGAEHLKTLPPALKFSQTEQYVEYTRTGKLVKGQERVVAKSKYEEDVYINNHKSVWGSYWENGQWGYACCHQFVKNSYCTGEAGKAAREASDPVAQAEKQRAEFQKPLEKPKKTKEDKAKEKAKEKEKEKASIEKLEAALKVEEERSKQVELDDRKRGYNSLTKNTWEVTDEEVEAYKLKRLRHDDPMKDFLAVH